MAPACMVLVCANAAWAAPRAKENASAPEFWKMTLDGGRSLTWQRSLSSEAEVKPNRGFWNKVWDVIAGAPDFHSLVRPYAVAIDSRGRIIVTDPGASGVHIFDLVQHKYKFIQRTDKSRDSMIRPQFVAVDAADNIYVTDSEAGVIFVFDAKGKFVHALGSLKGGEGYFKRPTGIAIDSAAERIYVTDTLRDKVFVLGMDGSILQTIGDTGTGEGEFNLPTDLRLDGANLLVADAVNFRVQAFDRSGKFEFAVGAPNGGDGAMFRPKSLSVDSEGDLYVVDGLRGVVQVVNRAGQLLYYFGAEGTHAGEFQEPTGLFIGKDDHVYVVDSFNRRVQIFQYVGQNHVSEEAAR
jgi:DNA-binding beta-propeller fold protein YncE